VVNYRTETDKLLTATRFDFFFIHIRASLSRGNRRSEDFFMLDFTLTLIKASPSISIKAARHCR